MTSPASILAVVVSIALSPKLSHAVSRSLQGERPGHTKQLEIVEIQPGGVASFSGDELPADAGRPSTMVMRRQYSSFSLLAIAGAASADAKAAAQRGPVAKAVAKAAAQATRRIVKKKASAPTPPAPTTAATTTTATTTTTTVEVKGQGYIFTFMKLTDVFKPTMVSWTVASTIAKNTPVHNATGSKLGFEPCGDAVAGDCSAKAPVITADITLPFRFDGVKGSFHQRSPVRSFQVAVACADADQATIDKQAVKAGEPKGTTCAQGKAAGRCSDITELCKKTCGGCPPPTSRKAQADDCSGLYAEYASAAYTKWKSEVSGKGGYVMFGTPDHVIYGGCGYGKDFKSNKTEVPITSLDVQTTMLRFAGAQTDPGAYFEVDIGDILVRKVEVVAPVKNASAVSLTMTVKNVDLVKLKKNASLLLAFTDAFEKEIAVASGDGIMQDHIHAKITEGADGIEAVIFPTATLATFAVIKSLASDASLGDLLVARLSSVPGVKALTTGVISVAHLVIKGSLAKPEPVTAPPSVAKLNATVKSITSQNKTAKKLAAAKANATKKALGSAKKKKHEKAPDNATAEGNSTEGEEHKPKGKKKKKGGSPVVLIIIVCVLAVAGCSVVGGKMYMESKDQEKPPETPEGEDLDTWRTDT